VGYLLDEIRLNGFHAELKEEIVRLGKRYGIVTPYTSFLVTEDTPRLRAPRRGPTPTPRPARSPAVPGGGAAPSPTPSATPTPTPTPSPMADGADAEKKGERAVGYSKALKKMKEADREESEDARKQGGKSRVGVKTVAGKSFRLAKGYWVDQDYDEKTFKGKTVKLEYMGTDYFTALKDVEALVPFFALGEKVKVLHDGVLYVVTPPGKKEEKKD
jgi:Ca-activated chloride channel family protein